MTDTNAALIDVLADRAGTYALLARFFRTEADGEFLAQLRSSRYPARTGVPAADRGYRLIVSYLSHAPADALTELAIDYTRTFIGAGNDGFSAAYPFESVYTSPKRLLMQGARDEVHVIYRAAGLDKQPSWKDGEDHIALELEFMQVLGQRALDALRAGDEDEAAAQLTSQKAFLEDHLQAWFPLMAVDMRKFSKTDFYQGLADLALGFLENDEEFLEDVLSEEE